MKRSSRPLDHYFLVLFLLFNRHFTHVTTRKSQVYSDSCIPPEGGPAFLPGGLLSWLSWDILWTWGSCALHEGRKVEAEADSITSQHLLLLLFHLTRSEGEFCKIIVLKLNTLSWPHHLLTRSAHAHTLSSPSVSLPTPHFGGIFPNFPGCRGMPLHHV